MSQNVTLSTSTLFHEDLRKIHSPKTLSLIAQSLVSISTFPDMGRLAQSTSIISRFGEGVRTLVCGNYLLVYTHEGNTVTALALYPARLVH